MNQDLINKIAELLKLKACFDELDNYGYVSPDAKADIIVAMSDSAFDILDELVCSMRKEGNNDKL